MMILDSGLLFWATLYIKIVVHPVYIRWQTVKEGLGIAQNCRMS